MTISKEQFNQNLRNSKDRISAAKGQFSDQLSDTITREYGAIMMMANQALDMLDDKEKKIAELQQQLSDVAKGKVVKLQENLSKQVKPQK